MPLILGANSASGGYNVANSLRFNSGSSDYLNRTPASSGNRQKWTWSGWFKKSVIGSGAYEYLFDCTDEINSTGRINNINNTTDSFQFADDLISADLRTTAVYRDSSAWYHLVVAMDTTQATASNRIKMYVNGSQITSFSTETYPSQNSNGTINLATGSYVHRIGTYNGSASFFNGYQSEVYFIDGQQLTPSSFGETDTLTGIWKPKAYAGTYGTNGFYLQFKNSAALGTDSSGNGNTWTVNNLTSVDQSTDTPTNNFSTLNPLANNQPANGNTFIYPDGALTFKGSAGVNTSQMMAVGTQAVSTGKWYWEAKLILVGADIPGIGILNTEANFNVANAYPHNSSVSAYGYTYMSNGQKSNNGTDAAYGNSYTTGDIMGVALDMINNKLYFSKNGTFQNSGDPTSGATGTGAAYTVQSALTYFPACNLRYYEIIGEWSFNFGSPAFTISSGNADANGYGNFEYAVPAGYYSLNTKNLAQYG
jgi:hypothetical protein